jgi:hypothetical protein
MMVIHMAGEELKKRLPDHVFKIEQERVKYLMAIQNLQRAEIEQERVKYLMAIQSLQRVLFILDLNRVYDLSPEERHLVCLPDVCGDRGSLRSGVWTMRGTTGLLRVSRFHGAELVQ